MFKLLPLAFAALAVLALAAPPVAAQWSGMQVGNSTYWSGPQGSTMSCMRVGNSVYCN